MPCSTPSDTFLNRVSQVRFLPGAPRKTAVKRPLTRENLAGGRSCLLRRRPAQTGRLRPAVPNLCRTAATGRPPAHGRPNDPVTPVQTLGVDLQQHLKTHSPEQTAAILNNAFQDPAWGVLVWLAMTTGARRGELCAPRFDRLDLNNQVISIRTSIGQDGTETWEKDTKTHQHRRITLDEATTTLLRAYRDRCEADANELAIIIAPNARPFSSAPDHST